MKDRCIICGIKKKLHEIDGMTICLVCFFKNGTKVTSQPFIENLINEKEKQINITQTFFYFKTVKISELKSFPKISTNELKEIRQEPAIQILLEEVKILKKQKSVRLKYIFETNEDE
ncbi:hypothetical protein BC2926_38900 [Bacillus cereus]|nr:hypothetical protein BC2926_38900 [Bacillus cereus]